MADDIDRYPDRLLKPAELLEKARRHKASYGGQSEVPRKTIGQIKREQAAKELRERPDQWVKARLRNGDKSWVLFSEKDWDAMTVHDRQKYEFARTNDPGNKYTLRGRLSGKRRGTRVYSSLGPTKLY